MRPSGELITRDDVLAARARIQGYVRRTPLLPPGAPSHPLWLKCEFLQYTGTFKTRGAFNRQLAARERGELDPTIGIVVASGGNAGLANPMPRPLSGSPPPFSSLKRRRRSRSNGFSSTTRVSDMWVLSTPRRTRRRSTTPTRGEPSYATPTISWRLPQVPAPWPRRSWRTNPQSTPSSSPLAAAASSPASQPLRRAGHGS